ncbi:MAG: hypothetical protein HFH60_12980 [Lachnospiraceae bacterium]|nr:hypothetical protein [Lachnospiraceae bacterium]
MTELEDSVDTTQTEKVVPEIQGDEDEPLFPEQIQSLSLKRDSDLDGTDDLAKEMARFRYKTGRTVLYISMSAMGTAVIIDLFSKYLNLESDLITNAFEAFKLITMTVLGYFFASNNSKFN